MLIRNSVWHRIPSRSSVLFQVSNEEALKGRAQNCWYVFAFLNSIIASNRFLSLSYFYIGNGVGHLMLSDFIVWLIREYKPTRSLLHNLVYLMIDSESSFMRWTISITGVYSDKIEEMVEDLVRRGIVIECSNGRLTMDYCPKDEIDGHSIVSQAVSKYLVSMTMRTLVVNRNK